MKRYLGEIWFKTIPKKKTWWRKEGEVRVHKFSERIIEAESYSEAEQKMKIFADEYVAEARKRPNAGFMKNLVHTTVIMEAI